MSTLGLSSLESLVNREPYVLKTWLRYLDSLSESLPKERYAIFQRALSNIPRSYKLWSMYLRERRAGVRGRSPLSAAWEEANKAHEMAILHLPSMPRLWLDYTAFLWKQGLVHRTRLAFDRALRSIARAQHPRIWKEFVVFARDAGVPDITVSVQERALIVFPDSIDDHVSHLTALERFDDAARMLLSALNRGTNGTIASPVDRERRADRFRLLVDLCAKHPKAIQSVRLERVVRSALGEEEKAEGDAARLWMALADYSMRLGNVQKARNVFEEALGSVNTVRDFSQLWDAYTRLEDKLLGLAAEKDDGLDAIELAVARYEHLVSRQPFLLNSVLLRQNPHNVYEWHKRVSLYKDQDDWIRALDTYEEAFATIEATKADGALHTLWLALAKDYEARGDVEMARETLLRARAADKYVDVDELATVWAAAIEFELRLKDNEAVQRLLAEALDQKHDLPISRSLKLWSLRADMEESFGSLDSACAVYDDMLRRKIATPQTVLCHAAMCEDHAHWERAFRAYERGVAAFEFPYSRDLWATYLERFVARYGGRKLERARDLFEQVLSVVPDDESTLFYVMYARLEETHGLARHAMAIYKRAAETVPMAEKAKMYLLYVARAGDRFGVAKTRPIYEHAIQHLPDVDAVSFARRYAKMETRLGEVDRARAIYTHACEMANPRTQGKFWTSWHNFEIELGNEDTYAEMSRLRRNVEALYSTGLHLDEPEHVQDYGEGDGEERGEDGDVDDQDVNGEDVAMDQDGDSGDGLYKEAAPEGARAKLLAAKRLKRTNE